MVAVEKREEDFKVDVEEDEEEEDVALNAADMIHGSSIVPMAQN
tara:strand:- start:602 stop:733 length:132 start_codon:yes stop_codon:yes gene_type:complete